MKTILKTAHIMSVVFATSVALISCNEQEQDKNNVPEELVVNDDRPAMTITGSSDDLKELVLAARNACGTNVKVTQTRSGTTSRGEVFRTQRITQVDSSSQKYSMTYEQNGTTTYAAYIEGTTGYAYDDYCIAANVNTAMYFNPDYYAVDVDWIMMKNPAFTSSGSSIEMTFTDEDGTYAYKVTLLTDGKFRTVKETYTTSDGKSGYVSVFVFTYGDAAPQVYGGDMSKYSTAEHCEIE